MSDDTNGKSRDENLSGRKIVTSVVATLVFSTIIRTILYNWLIGSEIIVGQVATLVLAFVLGFFLLQGQTWARWITVAFALMVVALSALAIARATVPVEIVWLTVLLGLSAYIVVALIFPHSVNTYFSSPTTSDR